MPRPEETIALYLKLADRHEKLVRFQERDRFLLLAADAALIAGRAEEAETIRRAILARNPHHLLKPYASLEEALKSPDILVYIRQLRRDYAHDKAAQLLDSLPPPPSDGKTGTTRLEEEFALPLDPSVRVPKATAPPRLHQATAPAGSEPISANPVQPEPAKETGGWASAAPFAMAPLESPYRPQTPSADLRRQDLVERATTPPPEDILLSLWVAGTLLVLGLAGAIGLFAYVIVRPLMNSFGS